MKKDILKLILLNYFIALCISIYEFCKNSFDNFNIRLVFGYSIYGFISYLLLNIIILYLIDQYFIKYFNKNYNQLLILNIISIIILIKLGSYLWSLDSIDFINCRALSHNNWKKLIKNPTELIYFIANIVNAIKLSRLFFKYN